jgi:hypothetical protein
MRVRSQVPDQASLLPVMSMSAASSVKTNIRTLLVNILA